MDIEQFKKEILTIPSDFGYSGDLDLSVWGFTYSMHRDSDTLNISNYEVILEDMQERFPDDVEVMHCNHWAFGWVDHIMVNTENQEALEAIYEWSERLNDYPVADEEDFSRREYEEACEAYDNWAGHDIDYMIENDEDLEFLLDENEWFSANEEQEQFLRDIIVDQILYNGGEQIIDLEKIKEYILKNEDIFPKKKEENKDV